MSQLNEGNFGNNISASPIALLLVCCCNLMHQHQNLCSCVCVYKHFCIKMVKSCCVCKNLQRPNEGISFHLFPSDKEKKQLWISTLKLKEADINKFSYVCSDHFTKEDIIKQPGRNLLKPDALPKALPNYSQQFAQTLAGPSKQIDLESYYQQDSGETMNIQSGQSDDTLTATDIEMSDVDSLVPDKENLSPNIQKECLKDSCSKSESTSQSHQMTMKGQFDSSSTLTATDIERTLSISESDALLQKSGSRSVSDGSVIDVEELPLDKTKTQKEYKSLVKASRFTIEVCKCAEKYFRFFNKTTGVYNKNLVNILDILVSNTLKILPIDAINYFGDHLYDYDPLNCHFNLLCKLILKYFFTIRIHYENKKKLDMSIKGRVRSMLTKTVLFKNQ